MPERVVKPSILTDEAVNRLSMGAEVFFRRLLSIVDDYGRYDGRPVVLRAQLFALRLDSVKNEDVEGWLGECIAAGLLRAYVVKGQQFIHFADFEQRLRSKRSKWPDPPADADICGHPQADAGGCGRMLPETETETETETGAGAETARGDARALPPATAAPVAPPAPLPALRAEDGPLDFAGENPVPEGALRPEDDPVVREICAVCRILALGVSRSRDEEVLRVASLIRASGGSAATVREFAEHKRRMKNLAPGEPLQMRPAWIADDWGEFLASREGAGTGPPGALVPPEGLSPGEQKRWLEEQYRARGAATA